jgi:RNA recognition motif-containing protein
MKRLYIGNLPNEATENELRDLLEDFGAVEGIEILKDKYTGRPKGSAEAVMASDEAALKVVKYLTGHQLHGKSMVVYMKNTEMENAANHMASSSRKLA